MIDKDLSERPNFKRILREGSGTFQAISAISGTDACTPSPMWGELPLIVVVALSSQDVFARWQRAALLTSGATGILCIGLLWLTWMLRRELRRRYRAERVLSELAAVDALTGLANRRILDERLRLEWDRAQRSLEPLTVLMIDVDHFKAFNDRHGHHGGDAALRTVAQVIGANIRRPADLAARYGGEEFAVVLPHTDAKGAWVIAEHIRSSIEHLPRVAGDAQPITASIGMSTWDKRSRLSLEALLLSRRWRPGSCASRIRRRNAGRLRSVHIRVDHNGVFNAAAECEVVLAQVLDVTHETKGTGAADFFYERSAGKIHACTLGAVTEYRVIEIDLKAHFEAFERDEGGALVAVSTAGRLNQEYEGSSAAIHDRDFGRGELDVGVIDAQASHGREQVLHRVHFDVTVDQCGRHGGFANVFRASRNLHHRVQVGTHKHDAGVDRCRLEVRVRCLIMAWTASAQIANWYQQRLAIIADQTFAEHQSPS
ncbi:diguanylate cyclase, GGDEF domain-containing protein [Ditylenchus destructor]|nr:diguanylate cyclase, GGDEF domain-containing protein [Ditylenchus destructor]